MLARIALYSTLGYLLDQGLGCQWNTWQFWSVLGLFWAAETLTRVETLEQIQQELERIKRSRDKDN